MTTVESLEQTIATLAPADLAALRRWFAQFDAVAWDAQIESDATAGKLDAVAAEALSEHRSGVVREI